MGLLVNRDIFFVNNRYCSVNKSNIAIIDTYHDKFGVFRQICRQFSDTIKLIIVTICFTIIISATTLNIAENRLN